MTASSFHRLLERQRLFRRHLCHQFNRDVLFRCDSLLYKVLLRYPVSGPATVEMP